MRSPMGSPSTFETTSPTFSPPIAASKAVTAGTPSTNLTSTWGDAAPKTCWMPGLPHTPVWPSATCAMSSSTARA